MTIARACFFGFVLGVAFGTTACNKTDTQSAQVAAQQPPPEALAGNLAPVAQNQRLTQQQPAPVQSVAPMPTNTVDTQAAGIDDSADNEPPVYTEQPPPPLPDYQQPPDPGENYYWTPGYWNYEGAGYYWVPGAWVVAPFTGALWTPPYWNYEGARYRLHPGYWASHVGYYGGINYGFGYVGRGYYGGYWNNGKLYYNRSVTNVNINVVHNVYNASVPVPSNSNRISYNGGKGGLNTRPVPAEMAVLQERRTPPVAAQVQHSRDSAASRQQFAAENRNRPAELVARQPLPAARPVEAQRPLQAQRPAPQRPEPQQPQRAQAIRPEPPRPEPQRPEPQRQEQPRPENRPTPFARPQQPASRPEPARPQVAPQPAVRPEPPRPQAAPAARSELQRPEPEHKAPERQPDRR
jgi:hypothetical protein